MRDDLAWLLDMDLAGATTTRSEPDAMAFPRLGFSIDSLEPAKAHHPRIPIIELSVSQKRVLSPVPSRNN